MTRTIIISHLYEIVKQSPNETLNDFSKVVKQTLEKYNDENIIVMWNDVKKNENSFGVLSIEEEPYYPLPAHIYLDPQKIKRVSIDQVLKPKQNQKSPVLFYVRQNNEWFLYQANALFYVSKAVR